MTANTYLIACQGPLQALAAITALAHLHGSPNEILKKSTVVFGGMYTGNHAITDVSKKIFSAWGATNFIDMTDVHALEHRDINKFTQILRERTKDILGNCNALHYTRPGQPFNMALTSLKPWEYRLCSGDGMQDFSFFGLPKEKWPETKNDICVGLLPVTNERGANFGKFLPVSVQEYKNIFTTSAAGLAELSAITNAFPTNCCLLALTSGVESKLIPSVQHEIFLYVDTVLATTTPGEHILIKGHPRGHPEKAHLLATKLKKFGYEVSIFEGYHEYPLELILHHLPIKKLLAPVSFTSLVTKLFYEHIEVILGWTEQGSKAFAPEWLDYLFRAIVSILSRQKAINNSQTNLPCDYRFEHITYEKDKNRIKLPLRL